MSLDPHVSTSTETGELLGEGAGMWWCQWCFVSCVHSANGDATGAFGDLATGDAEGDALGAGGAEALGASVAGDAEGDALADFGAGVQGNDSGDFAAGETVAVGEGGDHLGELFGEAEGEADGAFGSGADQKLGGEEEGDCEGAARRGASGDGIDGPAAPKDHSTIGSPRLMAHACSTDPVSSMSASTDMSTWPSLRHASQMSMTVSWMDRDPYVIVICWPQCAAPFATAAQYLLFPPY